MKIARLSGLAFTTVFVAITGACGHSESQDSAQVHNVANDVQAVVTKDSAKVSTAVQKDTSSGTLKKVGNELKYQIHKGAVKVADETQVSDKKTSENQDHIQAEKKLKLEAEKKHEHHEQ